MILRKPYAFLIKNFRFINFLILLFSSYILYKSSNTFTFFREYAASRQFLESDTLINDIVPIGIIVMSVFIIILDLSVVILFKKKDKPILFYLFSIIYYIIFIVCCSVSREVVKIIMFDGLDPRIARVMSDTWLIMVIFQVVLVIFSVIRTLGFDVKKFNFGEDLQELQINEEDNEEFELTTRFDADRVKMKAAMQKEEYKAFFYENKFIIITIFVLLFGVIPTTFIARNIILNKRYVAGEVIKLDDFNLKINGALVTKRDNKGNALFKGNNSYLILMFNINNLKEEKRGISINNLRLEINGNIYMPKLNYYDYFKDIGIGYNGNKISKESKDYIAVYSIDDSDLEHEVIVRYADKLTVKNSEVSAKYYRTIIKPEKLDIERTHIKRNLREDLIIDYKKLSGTKLNVSQYNLKEEFIYEVDGKTKYIVNNTGLVMNLKYSFASDNLSLDDFINNYVVIRYKYNNCTYTQNINKIIAMKDEIYLAVTESMKDASEIELVVNVRNTEYVYELK